MAYITITSAVLLLKKKKKLSKNFSYSCKDLAKLAI